MRHTTEALQNVADIWLHEGLKKGVENGLYVAGYHEIGRFLLRQYAKPIDDPILRTNIGGLELDRPVGVAPGWDKRGITILGWQALGAGHITVGGITLRPQEGNEMPRIRTFDEFIGDHGKSKSLNSLGFNSKGVNVVFANIDRQRHLGEVSMPVVAQVTLNKEMYLPQNIERIPEIVAETIRKLVPVADAISLGLSSPNTIGMRDAQAFDFIRRILEAARSVMPDDMPLILKGDGDGGDDRLEMYCRLVIEEELRILELINTTALPHIKEKYGAANLPGGIAGEDPQYQELADYCVKAVYEEVGDRADIIANGGINGPERGLHLITLGASALGINTGIRKYWLKLISRTNTGIASLVRENHPDATQLANVVGVATKRGAKLKIAA